MEFNSFWNLTSLFITAYLSYSFGIRKTKKEALSKNLLKRYETAYIPYIKTIYTGFGFNGFIDDKFDFASRNMYFELLTKNLHFWDVNTLTLYQKFYKAYLDMLEYDDGNTKENPNAPQIFKFRLTQITLSILEEAEEISNSLSLPSLAKPLLANYRHAVQELNQSKSQ